MSLPSTRICVVDASVVTVVAGVAYGEPLGPASQLVVDDIYTLQGARPRREILNLTPEPGGGFRCTETGVHVQVNAKLIFQGRDGVIHEKIMLLETGPDGRARVLLHCSGALRPGRPYRLIGVARPGIDWTPLNRCPGPLTAGTRLRMSDGRLARAEEIQPGDLLASLTGAPVRVQACSRATLRAEGRDAPVVIDAEALGNPRRLTLRASQRVLAQTVSADLGLRPERQLVRAEALVDGRAIRRLTGGFVDYLRLDLEAPALVQAEGVALELGPRPETILGANDHSAPLLTQPFGDLSDWSPETRPDGRATRH